MASSSITKRLLLAGIAAIAIYSLISLIFRYFAGQWPTLGTPLSGVFVYTFVVVPAIVKSGKKPRGVEASDSVQ